MQSLPLLPPRAVGHSAIAEASKCSVIAVIKGLTEDKIAPLYCPPH